MLSDERLAEIAEKHKLRLEYREHMPAGPYYYDSLGYVHNHAAALRHKPTTRTAQQTPIAMLVRGDDWFRDLKMDERIPKNDVAPIADLGQYVARVLDDDADAHGGLLAELSGFELWRFGIRLNCSLTKRVLLGLSGPNSVQHLLQQDPFSTTKTHLKSWIRRIVRVRFARHTTRSLSFARRYAEARLARAVGASAAPIPALARSLLVGMPRVLIGYDARRRRASAHCSAPRCSSPVGMPRCSSSWRRCFAAPRHRSRPQHSCPADYRKG